MAAADRVYRSLDAVAGDHQATCHESAHQKRVHTNADSLVGQVGIVIDGIDNVKGRGRVLIGGLDWAAVAEDGQGIEVNEQVLIKRIEGVKLIVEKII